MSEEKFIRRVITGLADMALAFEWAHGVALIDMKDAQDRQAVIEQSVDGSWSATVTGTRIIKP